MSAPKVGVQGVLERAGADAYAPEGSQAWALAQVGAAVAELIEAAGLRVEWVNGTWYVLNAGGAAFTNMSHANEAAAKHEAAEALRSALARIGGAA